MIIITDKGDDNDDADADDINMFVTLSQYHKYENVFVITMNKRLKLFLPYHQHTRRMNYMNRYKTCILSPSL